MSVHVEPISLYVKVFVALMVLTGATVWVAYYDLGAMNNVAALGIATLKACLVVLFFMHVRHGTKLVKLSAIGGFLWLFMMLAFVMTDYIALSTPQIGG